MKTNLFSALAIAATLFTTNLNAGNIENTYNLGETTLTISSESNAVIVNIGDYKNEAVTIKIEDAFGHQLLSETVKDAQSFIKKYNVSKLEDGSYNLVVSKKTIKTVQPFQIKNHAVVMSEFEKKEKFIPTVNFTEGKLNVNVLLGNYSNITVSIFDNEGRRVFDEKNYVVFDMHKRYDLSKLPKGAYWVEVMAGDETFGLSIEK